MKTKYKFSEKIKFKIYNCGLTIKQLSQQHQKRETDQGTLQRYNIIQNSVKNTLV